MTSPVGHEREGVAGVDAPAFVERGRSGRRPPPCPTGVAGVDAPAFVERTSRSGGRRPSWRVSPGLTLRPSLSVVPDDVDPSAPHVSPGLTLRPSLSAACRRGAEGSRDRVSPGLTPPAFVERGSGSVTATRQTGVAGVDAPAFVERD